MYINCFQFSKQSRTHLFIGPFADEKSAVAFRERIERTRKSSSLLTSPYAMEIAPGIAGDWGAVRPEAFKGFTVFDPETGEAVEIPLAD